MDETLSLMIAVLPIIWLSLNLFWAVLRGHGKDAVIYGVVLFAMALVALNLGGVLNTWTWHLAAIVVFSAEALFRIWRGPKWKVLVAVILLVLTVAGV